VRIQPQIPNGVTWAKTFKETPFGKLLVHWKINERKMEMEVEIPVGVEAEIVIQEGAEGVLLDGGEYAFQDKNSLINLKSGKYNISYTIN
jgi:alpha-L-rhamnosidase